MAGSRRGPWVTSILSALLIFFVNLPAAAQESDPADEFASLVQDELQSADYQTELPGPVTPPDPEDFKFPDWAKTLWKILWWTASLIAVAIIVYIIVKDVRARRGRKRYTPEADRRRPVQAPQPAEPPRAPVELSQIDDLVAKGEYGEAVHMLLAFAIQALAGRIKGTLGDSLTSREILADPRVQDDWRENFLPLVSATEAVVFAGQAADAELYDSCRNRLGLLLQTLWGRAR